MIINELTKQTEQKIQTFYNKKGTFLINFHRNRKKKSSPLE